MTQKINLQNLIIYFFLYSILGWLYEVFLEVVVYRWGFSNRGVLFGPYLPIYGTGALILILCLTRFKKHPLLVFLGGGVITTALELLGSYIMEATKGSWMWDYSTYFMNFQGRIALNPSVRFALGGLLFLYVIQPLFEKLTDRISDKIRRNTAIAIVVILITDAVIHVL